MENSSKVSIEKKILNPQLIFGAKLLDLYRAGESYWSEGGWPKMFGREDDTDTELDRRIYQEDG